MVKPRVFVSSTYYDLKHIRNNLKSFIEGFGYEPVLFENGDIPYDHQFPLDQSCYLEVTKCHMLVLIIGGRYGNVSSTLEDAVTNRNNDPCKSVTGKEYQSARDKDIPIYIFIEKNVYSEFRTYKANLNNHNVKYAYVDNVKIFEFIDNILSQKRNNQVCEFDKFDDICNWLRDQWAGLLAEYLRQRQDQKTLSNISSKIDELSQVSEALRTYTESLLKEVKPPNYNEIIQSESKKIENSRKKKIFFEHYFPDLIKELVNTSKANLYDNDIFDAFIQTDDFDEFLVKLGFDEPTIKSIDGICFYSDGYLELKSLLENNPAN